MVSSLQLPRGKVYESRDNRSGAADCYKEAVMTDLTFVEARPHVALLVELEKTSDLFKLSHSLVGLFSEWCVPWNAVRGAVRSI